MDTARLGNQRQQLPRLRHRCEVGEPLQAGFELLIERRRCGSFVTCEKMFDTVTR